MRDDKYNEDYLLRRYLLGELRDEEVDGLERRLLEDDDLFERMEAVEDDLLAACARGDLDSEERERVLGRLASSPRGRDRFALIQDLTRIAAEPRPNIIGFPSVLRWLPLAASLLVAVGGGSWFMTQMLLQEPKPLPDRHVAMELPETPVPPDPIYEDPNHRDSDPPPPPGGRPVPPPVPPPITATFKLALSTLRGAEEIQQLEIRQEVERVELQIDLGGDEHESYNVSLMDLTTGMGTWEKSGVPPQTLDDGRTALLLDVPAESFPSNGEYELTVDGLTNDGQLEFAGAPEFAVLHTVG